MDIPLVKTDQDTPLTCGACAAQLPLVDYTGDHYFEDDLIFYKIHCQVCGTTSYEKYELKFVGIYQELKL